MASKRYTCAFADIINQLENSLRQSEHHESKGNTNQAANHLEDMLKHLNQPSASSEIQPVVKALLERHIQMLIDQRTE